MGLKGLLVQSNPPTRMGFCRPNLNLAERKGWFRWRRDQSMYFEGRGG